MTELGYVQIENKSYSFSASVIKGTENFISFFDSYLDQIVAIFNPSTRVVGSHFVLHLVLACKTNRK